MSNGNHNRPICLGDQITAGFSPSVKRRKHQKQKQRKPSAPKRQERPYIQTIPAPALVKAFQVHSRKVSEVGQPHVALNLIRAELKRRNLPVPGLT